MMVFWLSTLVLLAAGALFIASSLYQSKSFNDDAKRDELNKAFYKERLSELEEEAAEGVVTDSAELVADLKQSLLDDIPLDKKQSVKTDIKPAVVFIPSLLLLIGVSYGMYFSFGAQDDVNDWNTAVSELPGLTRKLMSPDDKPLTDQEMQDLVLGLRTQLHESPDDAKGWLLLGRIGLSNRDVNTAQGALNRAYKLNSEDPDIRLGYAQSLMMTQDEQDRAQGIYMLKKLLQDNYVDLRIYSLLAFDAYQNNNFKSAISYWRMMQKMIGPEDQRYSMLERSIQNAQKALGTPVQDVTIPVTIALAEGVKVSGEGTLIVTVHDGKGSAIPVAAARYPVGSLPRTVLLDDNNVMMEGQSMSTLESVMVRVRIDVDGNVASKEGDWYGESSAVKLGEQVEIIINKQY